MGKITIRYDEPEINVDGNEVTLRFGLTLLKQENDYLKSVVQELCRKVPMVFKYMEDNHMKLYTELGFKKEKKDETERRD